MAKKLYGTDPDQVPTNADLGTMAYQDSKNTVLENAYINAKGADGLEMGEDYASRNNSSRLFFNSNTGTGNWSVFNNSGGLVFKSGAAAGSTSGNYTALSLTTSNVTIGGNLVVGNGSGIDFSAAQGGGASSSVLDDYEEGHFTASLTATTGGTITLKSTQDRLSYTKVGNFVHIGGRLDVLSVSSPTGALKLTLPFASKNGDDLSGEQVSAVWIYGLSTNVDGYYVMGRTEEGNTNYYIEAVRGDTSPLLLADRMQANSILRFGIVYQTG